MNFIESLIICYKKIFNYRERASKSEYWWFQLYYTLISGLEEGFGITMETDDVVDFSSFKKGNEILKKYKVQI